VAICWRWRDELETTSAGLIDRALLAHAHTLDEAREVTAAKVLAAKLAGHCDAETTTVIAIALALTRDDGAFTTARVANRRDKAAGRRCRGPRSATCYRRGRTISSLRCAGCSRQSRTGVPTAQRWPATSRPGARGCASAGPTSTCTARPEADLAGAYQRGEKAEAH